MVHFLVPLAPNQTVTAAAVGSASRFYAYPIELPCGSEERCDGGDSVLCAVCAKKPKGEPLTLGPVDLICNANHTRLRCAWWHRGTAGRVVVPRTHIRKVTTMVTVSVTY